MTHEEFKIEAQRMFDGQFPNDIEMRKPDISMMFSNPADIRDELKEWIDVTIDKYKELVTPMPTNIIREKKLLAEFRSRIEHWAAYGGPNESCLPICEEFIGKAYKQGKDDNLQAIEDGLPGEEDTDDHGDFTINTASASGFNACRSAVLNKLNEMRGL